MKNILTLALFVTLTLSVASADNTLAQRRDTPTQRQARGDSGTSSDYGDAPSSSGMRRRDGLPRSDDTSSPPSGSGDAPDRSAYRAAAGNTSAVTVLEGDATNRITYVAFSPDGKKFVTCGSNSNYHSDFVQIWDADTGRELRKLDKEADGTDSAVFSPDGKRVITTNGRGIFSWDAETGKHLLEILKFQNSYDSAMFSLSGKKIVMTSWLPHGIRIIDAQSGKSSGIIAVKDTDTRRNNTIYFRSIAFSPDEKNVIGITKDDEVRVLNVASGKELTKHEGVGAVRFVAFSPDGKKTIMVNGDDPDYARIWAVSGKELLRIEGHTGGIMCAAFSPDGTKIVTTSLDVTARIWDAGTGKELHQFALKNFGGNTAALRYAVFSPDGTKVVTAAQILDLERPERERLARMEKERIEREQAERQESAERKRKEEEQSEQIEKEKIEREQAERRESAERERKEKERSQRIEAAKKKAEDDARIKRKQEEAQKRTAKEIWERWTTVKSEADEERTSGK